MVDILIKLGIIVLRVLLSVLFLFITSKLVGVRQIAQMTFYDYVVGITIGSIAAMAVDEQIPIWHIIASLFIFSGFTVFLAFLTNKSIVLRRFLTGKPKVLVFHGKIIEKNLASDNYDMNDFLSQCRLKGFFNIDDINCAVLETDGQISILPKADKRPLTPNDISATVPKEDLQYSLVIDGTLLKRNLKAYGKDEQWLKQKMNEQSVKSYNEILLAVGDANDKLCIFKKHQQIGNDNIFI